MLTVLSLVTSVKDYLEIAHKLIESQNGNFLDLSPTGMFRDYTELGAVLTYLVLSIKEFLTSFLSFAWLKQIWSLPLIVPDIASAMISEVSVLDSYFTNAFSFLETGLSTSVANSNVTSENTFIYAFEKFITGLLNSFFLFLPTSTAHLITLRRFVIQGLEAGYIAGLGTIAGNVLWLTSIIFGWRFIVIPWLSFDIFRYILGFSLLVKYLWDSSKEINQTNKTVLEDNTKKSIFVLNFLLALTEQTSIYPFISNISFGAEGSILESFSGPIFQSYTANSHLFEFVAIHGCYLLGIILGCFSLLQFTVWFWENPAFSIYMWMITSYRVTTSSYYKVLNFIFLYLTMLCAISSIPYFGLDYTVTNPLGLIPQDRIIDQKFTTANGTSDRILQETAFLNVNPTDYNTRTRDGMHANRQRWKARLVKYQAFDTSIYDQGNYDFLTIEDLNYGFDRFWLRRKMRNHQIRFRLFPGPWMRSLKKQLNKPGFSGPRVEFFRILFEQYYHPIFHATTPKTKQTSVFKPVLTTLNSAQGAPLPTGYLKADVANQKTFYTKTEGFGIKDLAQTSALRKFARNFNNRLTTATLEKNLQTNQLPETGSSPIWAGKGSVNTIYSKSFKSLYARIGNEYSKEKLNLFRNISRNLLLKEPQQLSVSAMGNNFVWSKNANKFESGRSLPFQSIKKANIRQKLSKKERLLLTYKMQLFNPSNGASNLPGNFAISRDTNQIGGTISTTQASLLGKPLGSSLEPLKYYLQKDEAFQRKLKYYSTTVVRNLSVGNNAPYFKTMLKRAFYYHKPSLRWKRTMFQASMIRGFRKKSNRPKKLLALRATTTLNSDQKLDPAKLGDPRLTDFTVSAITSETPAYGDTNTKASTLINRGNSPSTDLSGGTVSPSTLTELQAPIFVKTSSYSVLGKRASRYRYQIYKDVLQHWYYSPFNRLLLKFDIDAFMNRQPKSQFLTKKEERLLHLRRLLLAEHYNSLRWYTYMQHYRTMKSRIGSTKSFANTAYNQQFQGTFKKIRHLFSITPVQGDMPILKFDQPLYNEYNLDLPALRGDTQLGWATQSNSKTGLDAKAANSGALTKYLQEDLANTGPNTILPNSQGWGADLVDQSLNVAGEYMKMEQRKTQEQIQNYLSQQKNYSELSKLLLGSPERKDFSNTPNPIVATTATASPKDTIETKEILLRLLTECKRRLNDQAFLKNYITHRIDKREKRYAGLKAEMDNNLESLQNWLSPISLYSSKESKLKERTSKSAATEDKLLMQTTGVQKALNEGVFVLNNINPTTPLSKNNILSKLSRRNGAGYTPISSSPDRGLSLAVLEKEKKIQQTLKSIKLVSAKNSGSTANRISKVFKPVLETLRVGPYAKVLANQNNVLAARAEKNLEWWKQKQRVMTKRKESRKADRFTQLKADNAPRNQERPTAQLNKSTTELTYALPRDSAPYQIPELGVLRKKLDSTQEDALEQKRRSLTGFKKLFMQKFKAKKSSRLKGSSLKVSPLVRPKNNLLASSLGISDINQLPETSPAGEDKKEALQAIKQKLAKNLATYSSSLQDEQLSATTKSNLQAIKNALVKGSIKKSPISKRSKHLWRKLKRGKSSQNQSQYNKRKVHGYGKLRKLNKKLKRIQAVQELQNWWWNIYLPRAARTLNQNQASANTSNKTLTYKPLSTNQALDIRQNLLGPIAGSSEKFNTGFTVANSNLYSKFDEIALKENNPQANELTAASLGVAENKSNSPNVLDQIYLNTLVPGSEVANPATLNSTLNQLAKNYITTNIPFYAGWDESLRKFVVTNRLLSRRDTGFRVTDLNTLGLGANLQSNSLTAVDFDKAPIQGLNEGSFLYLQTEMPFNSYLLDQFIPNQQSFYAPLGWKRFEFRHSLLKNWHAKINKETTNNALFLKKESLYGQNTAAMSGAAQKTIKNAKILQNKRLKKRFSLMNPTPTVQQNYAPTGPLLNEILPSHYISVFDKQYRLPRNRYLKRFLPQTGSNSDSIALQTLGSTGTNPQQSDGTRSTIKDLALLEYSNSVMVKNSATGPSDFTLRKKVKPRRKFHKKRFVKKDGLIFPRRQKFTTLSVVAEQAAGDIASSQEEFRLRPSTKAKQNYSKTKSKTRGPKTSRLRQLRNREYKQVVKPLKRFQPRAGGFVWPGDYLRLEVVPMPKLTFKTESTKEAATKTKVQNKIAQQPVGLQPRKYLLEKHNLKVLLRKKQLAQNLTNF